MPAPALILVALGLLSAALLFRRRQPDAVAVRVGRAVAVVVAGMLLARGVLELALSGPPDPPRPPPARVALCTLPTAILPQSRDGFVDLFTHGLGAVMSLPAGATPVTASGGGYPQLDALDVNVTEARLADQRRVPRPRLGSVDGRVVRVARFSIVGEPVRYQQAAIRTRLTAADVELAIERDKNGVPLLVLRDARDGHFTLDMARGDVESIIRTTFDAEGRKYYLSVEEARLAFVQEGPRATHLTLDLKVKQFGVAAHVRFAGRVTLDDELVATVSDLTPSGQGAVGSAVMAIADPLIRRYEGYRIPLRNLFAAELPLRNVHMEAGETLHVTATFGR